MPRITPGIGVQMIVILVIMIGMGLVISLVAGRRMKQATTYRELFSRFLAWFGGLTIFCAIAFFISLIDAWRRWPLIIFASYLGLAWALFSSFFVARDHVGERRRSTQKRVSTASRVPAEPAPAPTPKPSETKETTL